MDEEGSATSTAGTGQSAAGRNSTRLLNVDEDVQLITTLQPYLSAFEQTTPAGVVTDLLEQIRTKNPSDLERLLKIMVGDAADLLLMKDGLDLALRMRELLIQHNVPELMVLGVAIGIINGS